MAIEQQQTVTLASTEVSDAYQVELTVRDSLSGALATVSLTWSQTQDLVDELLARNGEAVSAYWEDRGRPAVEHGFDVDVTVWDGTGSVEALARPSHVHDTQGNCLKNRDGALCSEPVLGFAVINAEMPGAICRDCSEGKHGACIGSAYAERDGEIVEVACACTADGHRGRS